MFCIKKKRKESVAVLKLFGLQSYPGTTMTQISSMDMLYVLSHVLFLFFK